MARYSRKCLAIAAQIRDFGCRMFASRDGFLRGGGSAAHDAYSEGQINMKWLISAVIIALFVSTATAAPLENPPVPGVCGWDVGTLASTCLFTGNIGAVGGRPVSARTDFMEDWDTRGWDGLTLATHELFHAIGFTVAYTNFDNHVFVTPGAGGGGIPAGSRVYSTNGTVGGIRMTLTPSGDGTHADPNATGAAPWPATGYNQANDIMQPLLPQGVARTLSNNNFNVLDDAFGWATTGITINVINIAGTHSDVDLSIIAAAVAAIEGHYNTAGNVEGRPVFTWSVAEVVPEPGTWAMTAGTLAVVIAASRRRRRAGR